MPLGVKCRDAQYATCEQESRCTGASSECPRSPPMKDGTSCLERGQCKGGKCIPYCETQNLQSCMCDTSTHFILTIRCLQYKWRYFIMLIHIIFHIRKNFYLITHFYKFAVDLRVALSVESTAIF